MDSVSRSRLAEYFEAFSRVHAAPSSPLYERFTAHVANSPDLLEVAAKAKKGQPPANLLLAAVHYLLRQSYPDAPLAAYYPSLGGAKSVDEGVARLFENFIWDHEREVKALICEGVTNTNEVGRCAVLLPGFTQIAKEADVPLHLIEVGPSCGLNLAWDQYRYRYGDQVFGREDSPFELSARLEGANAANIIGAMPAVASRSGLELHPVNNDDPATLAWQLALIWPEHVDRAERITHAFEVARRVPARVYAGDAVESIPQVLASLPDDGAVCVFHSFCMYQIPAERKQKLSEILQAFSVVRPVWRLAYEWLDAGDGVGGGGENELGIARYKDGAATFQRLALCGPHGREMNWAPQDPQLGDSI